MSLRRRRSREPDHSWMGPLPAAAGCDCQICRPESAYDARDRATLDGVLRHGWRVLLVSDADGCDEEGCDGHPADDGAGPPFAYTVGLGHRADHPELLMSGLDRRVMHHAVNVVAEQVLAGRRFRPGDVVEGVLGGWPVVLEQVSEAGLREAVIWSGWFHRRRPEALALVWPSSTTGLFPWQPGAAAEVDAAQPRAWREPFEHVGAAAPDPPWVLPAPPEQLVLTCVHVLEQGMPVLWAARERDPDRGEDWSIHCGGGGHTDDEVRLVHLAHLVRAAPGLRELQELGPDEEALRRSVDDPWVTGPVP